MKKQDIYTLISLGVLTTLTAVFSNTNGIKYVAFIILFLSAIKFIFVAFQFMELKKANKLWKILLVGLLVFFVGTVSLVVG